MKTETKDHNKAVKTVKQDHDPEEIFKMLDEKKENK